MAIIPKALGSCEPEAAIPPSGAPDRDTWLDAQTVSGLLDADDPNTVWMSNEEVFRQIDQRLELLKERKAS